MSCQKLCCPLSLVICRQWQCDICARACRCTDYHKQDGLKRGMNSLPEQPARHPAVTWALQAEFNPQQVDCTTAVVLKILDNKCKMSAGEKAAVMAIYNAVKQQPAELFGTHVHEAIRIAQYENNGQSAQMIHELRLQAEARIAKPVMKSYKAFLRNGLFG